MTNTSMLYILYNADASVLGKLKYGYRKLTSPKDQPACAACDITHGGLHLDETAEWKTVKEEIANSHSVEMTQWHRDEASADIKKFVEINGLRYPLVLSRSGGEDFKVILDHNELAAIDGNAQTFVLKLHEKGALGSGGSSSSL